MSDYEKGWTKPPPTPDQGPSLAFLGIPKSAMPAWSHLLGKLENEVAPCYSRPEWLSSRAADKRTAIRLCGDCPAQAACRDFAQANHESFGIWGAHDFSKGKP